MPNFQTSGAISFSELQSRFGGSNPINFSEYYRNGSYVDGTATTTTTQGPNYNYNNYNWYFMTPTTSIIWNGSSVYSQNTSATTVTTGGWTYTRGSFQYNDGYGLSYSVSRSQSSTTNINTGIPTSGTISLNQFYGAQY